MVTVPEPPEAFETRRMVCSGLEVTTAPADGTDGICKPLPAPATVAVPAGSAREPLATRALYASAARAMSLLLQSISGQETVTRAVARASGRVSLAPYRARPFSASENEDCGRSASTLLI